MISTMTRRRVARDSEIVPGQRARPVRERGGQDHAIAGALQMGRHVARQLLRAEPVDEQGRWGRIMRISPRRT
jgi:hypothetical protein